MGDTMRELREENKRLKKQNEALRCVLDEKTRQHKAWEEMAVRFHDTLWQVLLKYEPDTYGVLYPERRAEDTALDFSQLPDIE